MIIDIHSHILPSVDDGSKDLSMSIAMAKLYLENGIKKVIATPHYIKGAMDSLFSDNQVILERLKKELLEEELDLEVFLGNEIYVSLDTLEDLSKNKVSSLNNSRYVLLELPMQDIPLFTENLLYELQLKGYIPIIAHPERNKKIMEDPNILYHYIKKGSLAQINLPSLEGSYGKLARTTALRLLEHRMIHFIGADAHSNRNRSPNVSEALKLLKEKTGQELFENITVKNAECVLGDKPIEVKEPVRYKEKNGLFRFLRK